MLFDRTARWRRWLAPPISQLQPWAPMSRHGSRSSPATPRRTVFCSMSPKPPIGGTPHPRRVSSEFKEQKMLGPFWRKESSSIARRSNAAAPCSARQCRQGEVRGDRVGSIRSELPTRPKGKASKPRHPVAQGAAQRSCVGARSCLHPTPCRLPAARIPQASFGWPGPVTTSTRTLGSDGSSLAPRHGCRSLAAARIARRPTFHSMSKYRISDSAGRACSSITRRIARPDNTTSLRSCLGAQGWGSGCASMVRPAVGSPSNSMTVANIGFAYSPQHRAGRRRRAADGRPANAKSVDVHAPADEPSPRLA